MLAARGEKGFRLWGYPPERNSQGVVLNVGCVCGYCSRVFASRYKHKGYPNTKALKVALGGDGDMFNKFIGLTEAAIQVFIKNSSLEVAVNWDQLERTIVVKKEVSSSMLCEPNEFVWEFNYYVSQKDDPSSNGLGHRVQIVEGEKSVIVPGPPIRKLKRSKAGVEEAHMRHLPPPTPFPHQPFPSPTTTPSPPPLQPHPSPHPGSPTHPPLILVCACELPCTSQGHSCGETTDRRRRHCQDHR